MVLVLGRTVKEMCIRDSTITFGDYAAKDFPLVVRTNDELHSALFIRSGDIKTNGEKTTITFDTSNIKTRLSNNFSWNVDNTDFNNYVINNPHGNKMCIRDSPLRARS